MNKSVVVFIIIFIGYGLYDCSNRAKERESRKEQIEQWKRSPAGMNYQAKSSSLSKDYPIRSQTGILFYKGMHCSYDCSGHIAGYEYAIDYGMINKDKCDESESISFTEGCKKAVDDIIDEMQPSDDGRIDYYGDASLDRY